LSSLNHPDRLSVRLSFLERADSKPLCLPFTQHAGKSKVCSERQARAVVKQARQVLMFLSPCTHIADQNNRTDRLTVAPPFLSPEFVNGNSTDAGTPEEFFSSSLILHSAGARQTDSHDGRIKIANSHGAPGTDWFSFNFSLCSAYTDRQTDMR